MLKKALVIALLATYGLILGACSGPCGFIWDDWRSSKSCRAEPAPQK